LKNATRLVLLLAAACSATAPAAAREGGDNAVAAADDAFGTSSGRETSGIYTENDTRGFSPLKAGNARLDGLYFDPVATMSNRLRPSTAIRVGFAALDRPFPAPTGIAEYHLRGSDGEFGLSLKYVAANYGGAIGDLDLKLPVTGGVDLLIGGAAGRNSTVDGAVSRTRSFTLKPVLRGHGFEISPFYSILETRSATRPVVVVATAAAPPVPEAEHYFGQDWAVGDADHLTAGVTARASLAPRLALRAGAFHSSITRFRNYTEIFRVIDPAGTAAHSLLSDPRQHTYANSWEIQAAWKIGSGPFEHSLIAGYRGRLRHTETGGSDRREFGLVVLGERDPETRPDFTYGPVSRGTIRQDAWMLGYTARRDGLGMVNLGVQRVSYRSRFVPGSGPASTSSDRPWLFNASVSVETGPRVAFYIGTVRGLEDSGVAPESAANRSEQLPAARTTQYDGGVRFKFPKGQVLLSAFQIEKPYFSFDALGRYAALGTERHRGVEVSYSGKAFHDHLRVLGGAVIMSPTVSGAARDAGLVGPRPAGTPRVSARLDLAWQTGYLNALTPTLALAHVGARAAGSRVYPELGGRQLMLPPHTTLDLGLRDDFPLGRLHCNVRFVVANVFDSAAWKVIAANTLQQDDRRRWSLDLGLEF